MGDIDLKVLESFLVMTEGDSGVFELVNFGAFGGPSMGELLLLFPFSTTFERFFAMLSRLNDFAALVDFCIGDSNLFEVGLLRIAETW